MAGEENRLLNYVREHPNRVVEITQTLVRYNTAFIGPGAPVVQEKEAQTWAAGFLRDLGFTIDQWEPDVDSLRSHPQYVDGLNWNDRPVTVGVLKGTGGGKSLIFNGHLDTVPAEPIERWTRSPWDGVIEGDRLYGRGSNDMKGGIAAFLALAEAIVRSGVNLSGDLIVQVSTDEESTGMGTVAIVERGYRADACIVTEPTHFKILTAYRGLLACKITVTGRPGHADLPQPHWRDGGGVNAIDKMRIVQEAIDQLNREWWGRPDKQHGLLANPQAVPTVIRGGEFLATIPSSCELELDIHYLPANADESGFGSRVRAEIDDHIQRAAMADPWLRENPPVVSYFGEWPGAETSPDSEIIRAVRKAAADEGVQAEIAGTNSWTDAASYLRAGVPAICFGPGGSPSHILDEWASITGLQTATRALARVVTAWCGAR